jgi:uncharacterized protein
MNKQEFEWDAVKAARNEADHGVTFEMAKDVFKDPFAIEWLDDREDYGEDRYGHHWHGEQPFALCRLHYEG